jgi:hypothetical protein
VSGGGKSVKDYETERRCLKNIKAWNQQKNGNQSSDHINYQCFQRRLSREEQKKMNVPEEKVKQVKP